MTGVHPLVGWAPFTDSFCRPSSPVVPQDVTASETWPLDLLRLALTAGVDVAVSLADKPHDEFLSPFFECLDETFQVRG